MRIGVIKGAKFPKLSFTQAPEYRKWYDSIKHTIDNKPKTMKELLKEKDPFDFIVPTINTH